MRSLFSPVRQKSDRKDRPARLLRMSRFGRDEDGATAVEFAMVSAPFFAMLFAIISIAHFFWVGATLEDAVQEAGRQIRVGKVEAVGLGKNDFKDFICSLLVIPKVDCLASILVDVESSPNIAGLSAGAPDPNDEKYDPGDGTDYVIVKAELPITSFNSLFRLFDSKAPDSFKLTAVTAFRNEPFN